MSVARTTQTGKTRWNCIVPFGTTCVIWSIASAAAVPSAFRSAAGVLVAVKAVLLVSPG